jgi:Flp pilus assembly protein TadD
MIRLSRQSAEKYLKQISPYEEETQLILLSGNEVGMNLIRGNAYQEAIAYLQELDQKTAEDEYNLGLAYEATGNSGQARIHYETALQQSPGNSQILEALSRLK